MTQIKSNQNALNTFKVPFIILNTVCERIKCKKNNNSARFPVVT